MDQAAAVTELLNGLTSMLAVPGLDTPSGPILDHCLTYEELFNDPICAPVRLQAAGLRVDAARSRNLQVRLLAGIRRGLARHRQDGRARAQSRGRVPDPCPSTAAQTMALTRAAGQQRQRLRVSAGSSSPLAYLTRRSGVRFGYQTWQAIGS